MGENLLPSLKITPKEDKVPFIPIKVSSAVDLDARGVAEMRHAVRGRMEFVFR